MSNNKCVLSYQFVLTLLYGCVAFSGRIPGRADKVGGHTWLGSTRSGEGLARPGPAALLDQAAPDQGQGRARLGTGRNLQPGRVSLGSARRQAKPSQDWAGPSHAQPPILSVRRGHEVLYGE